MCEAALGRFAHQKDMASQEPSPSGAVKAREAPAQRLGLDGEHGDGMGSSRPNWRHCSRVAPRSAARRYSPMILTSARLRWRPSNSP
jgi:hypothetical protein